MKKQILLICEKGLQFAIVIDELSVDKVMKGILYDINNKPFVCLSDYVNEKDTNTLWVRSSTVKGVAASKISNIQTPNRNLIVPTGRPN